MQNPFYTSLTTYNPFHYSDCRNKFPIVPKHSQLPSRPFHASVTEHSHHVISPYTPSLHSSYPHVRTTLKFARQLSPINSFRSRIFLLCAYFTFRPHSLPTLDITLSFSLPHFQYFYYPTHEH